MVFLALAAAGGLGAAAGPRDRTAPFPLPARFRLLKLAAGAGHSGYGEGAWPNDIFFVFPPAIESLLACGCGLASLAAPPLQAQGAGGFITPIEVLPEWYLYPTFGLLRAPPSKAAGILSVVGLLVGAAAAPFPGELGAVFLQNPWSRPASSSAALLSAAASLSLSAGALLPLRLSAAGL